MLVKIVKIIYWIDLKVVIVPYNTLLHKPTRDSLGIKLKNSVIIIDEAHKLLDTISHIHSSEIRGDQLLLVNLFLTNIGFKFKEFDHIIFL